MNKNSRTALLILLSTVGSFAQELYVPRNIQRAIDKGSRTLTGEPGSNYWQNKGVYDILFKVTPKTRLIEGSESIKYTNNSPDTLKTLVIRFVNNLHKPNAAKGNYSSDNFMTSGLRISKLFIDGIKYDEDAKNWGTVGTIRLKTPILPRSSASIQIDWDFPLSKEDGREGQVNPTTFFAAYAYPRVSVYDDYNGWDLLEHTGRQEFYNDFNDYTYTVTAPKNYIVYGTGVLQNPDEVLQPVFADRLKTSLTSDEIIHVANKEEVQKGRVTAKSAWNTWKFVANHISDITFALSASYVWDATSVMVDSATGRRASFQVAYADTAADFKEYAKWARHSLKYFSTEWPGVPYPFPTMTAFQGNADMEYPMMVNDASTPNFMFSRLLLNHEMVHTYFPFYMGINETRYAFMDEGWAVLFEYMIGQVENGKEAADNMFKGFRSGRYISDYSSESDQPIITQSSQQAGMGYSSNSYGKAALSYLALKDLLGDKVFKQTLHHYMNTWHGKHPIPWDFFNAMNAGAQQDLNWFFDNWFFSNNYIDLKLEKVERAAGGVQITVKNTGGYAIPFDIKIHKKDGTSQSFHQSPQGWKKGNELQTVLLIEPNTVSSIEIDNGIFVDYTPKNNVMKF